MRKYIDILEASIPKWKKVREGLYMRRDGATVTVNLDGPGWLAYDPAGALHGLNGEDMDAEPFSDAREAMEYLDVLLNHGD